MKSAGLSAKRTSGPGGDFKKRLNEATATSFSRSLLNTVFSIYNAGMERGRKSAAALAVSVDVGRERALLRPPASLSEAERSIWVHVITAARPEHFRPGDEPLLMRFCEVSAACDHAAEKLRTDLAKGRMPSSWLSTQERLLKMLVVLCRHIASVAAGTDAAQGRTGLRRSIPTAMDTPCRLTKGWRSMTPNDLAALKLAMEHANKEPARAAQLRSMLKDQSWDRGRRVCRLRLSEPVAASAAVGAAAVPWRLRTSSRPGSEEVAGSNVGRWHLALSSRPDGGARSGEAEGCRVIS